MNKEKKIILYLTRTEAATIIQHICKLIALITYECHSNHCYTVQLKSKLDFSNFKIIH